MKKNQETRRGIRCDRAVALCGSLLKLELWSMRRMSCWWLGRPTRIRRGTDTAAQSEGEDYFATSV